MPDDTGFITGASDGGVAASLAALDVLPVPVGPASENQVNTVRFPLIPVACWRLDDIRFEFDSSVVRPDARGEIQQLARLVRRHPGSPMSLFGHADPTGNDDYNKILSGRRAAAIYGMLTRNAAVWEDLFSNTGLFARPAAGDRWGDKALELMLDEVQGPQAGRGRPVGPAARRQLFLAYMDRVSQDADRQPFKLDKRDDFLGHNQDALGKGDFQGCGEFNPVLIFSAADQARFERDSDKADRNDANAPNRRVMALLFRKGSRVEPAKWPCPRAKEGTADCKRRFWSDGESRRTRRLPDEPRQFEKTEDTFACRFYHRLAISSPCDRVQARASWITEIPDNLEDEVFLLIRAAAGGAEVARLKPDQAAPGPATNRTFDLSRLDANIPVLLELHAGEKFIAPIVNLAINALRLSLAASNNQSVGGSLFVAEGQAGPSDPFDDAGQIDPTGEPQFPVDEDRT
jgi:hypothetical protein